MWHGSLLVARNGLLRGPAETGSRASPNSRAAWLAGAQHLLGRPTEARPERGHGTPRHSPARRERGHGTCMACPAAACRWKTSEHVFIVSITDVQHTRRAMSREPTRTGEARRRGGRRSPACSDIPARENGGVVGEDSDEVLQDREVLGLLRDTKSETGNKLTR
jgi:hypothetical protein